MRALGVVEQQGTGDGVEHALRQTLEVAALEARVVLHRHACDLGHLAAAQPLHPAAAAKGRQARLLRRDPGPPRGQELAHLAPVVHPLVHADDATGADHGQGVPAVTPHSRAFHEEKHNWSPEGVPMWRPAQGRRVSHRCIVFIDYRPEETSCLRPPALPAPRIRGRSW